MLRFGAIVAASKAFGCEPSSGWKGYVHDSKGLAPHSTKHSSYAPSASYTRIRRCAATFSGFWTTKAFLSAYALSDVLCCPQQGEFAIVASTSSAVARMMTRLN